MPIGQFIREYHIPLDLNMVLPSKNEAIYSFREGKFPLYTRVCNFANYRVPFSKFLNRVLRYFRVHLCQVNLFGISRISHFEISCRALDQRPDLDVHRYFYEFITADDWYTFAHRKGVPSPSGDERSSLKNWKDNFFWLDDRCLPVEMVWRFKDQTMSFDLDDDFVFDKRLAKPLLRINPLFVPFLNIFFCGDGFAFPGAEGIGTGRSSARSVRVSSAAYEIRPPPNQITSEPSAADATTSITKPTKGTAGSSGPHMKVSILDDVDSDPEVRSLNEALEYKSSHVSLKSKGVLSDTEQKGLVHQKRKAEGVQIRFSPSLLIPKLVKRSKGSSRSHSSDNIMTELDEHLSGGKSSREEAASARSAPTPAYSGGFLSVNETENMDVENPITSGKGDGYVQGGAKVVTSSGTILGSSLGPDCFIDDEEDQVSSLPPSWFGPELMSFFHFSRHLRSHLLRFSNSFTF
ncbi:hypothetical protein Hdeb2414_s0041g00736671 [Helianthus debilis subsp. tardiflorus]